MALFAPSNTTSTPGSFDYFPLQPLLAVYTTPLSPSIPVVLGFPFHYPLVTTLLNLVAPPPLLSSVPGSVTPAGFSLVFHLDWLDIRPQKAALFPSSDRDDQRIALGCSHLPL
ncbi:hypothetical protein VN97_g11698 [Penicillium thymicola]|uniref:Uncharacterized protein n=1 Tax=Penicillium thymicola TaxID=293382 RepID=A0AAI9T7G7_PENTH|nr:hypothetical protein VN97_g11698 [Penicillium thymicola]